MPTAIPPARPARITNGTAAPITNEGAAQQQAAAAIEDYRRSHQVTDPDRALGRVPHDPGQRVAWQHARQAITRVQGRQRSITRDRQPHRAATTGPSWIDRHQQDQAPARAGQEASARRPGPERAAG